MWGALFRQLAIFLFTRRGKRIAALIGLVLLGFVTALLIDSQMYLSAAFSSAMTLAALLAFIFQSVKNRKRERERVRRAAAEEIQRAAAARGTASNVARLARTGVAVSRNRLKRWRRKED